MAVINTDPDGFACYSDHTHDIHQYGECTWCGSTEADVVGTVLPDVERLTGIDPVRAARIVVSTATMRIVDGVLLDFFTAQHIVAVADKLGPDALTKLKSMTIDKAGVTCLKLVAKLNGLEV